MALFHPFVLDNAAGLETVVGIGSDSEKYGVAISEDIHITGIQTVDGFLNAKGGIKDTSGDMGDSGQVLSSTGSGLNWINAGDANVASASNVGTNANTTNADQFVAFLGASSGNNPIRVDAGLKYNPSTNILKAGNVELPNLGEFTLGDSQELKMFHKDDTSDVRVEVDSSTNYILLTKTFDLKNAAGSKAAITATNPGGVPEVLLYHDGNERLKTTDNGVTITGTVSATSFSGSGANLTSLPTQVTLSNNADNRVITGGSGVNLNGESKLTFNGTNLRTDISTAVDGILGEAYSGYFGLKHSDQSLSNEYMIISNNSHTYISATSGSNVYIRNGNNDSTNQLIVGSGNDALTWRGNKIFHAGNDGDSSGLDADKLDGSEASHFLNIGSTTQQKNGAIRIGGSSSGNGFGIAWSMNGTFAPASVGHAADHNEGFFWHSNASYGIYRTAGNWSSPNYQQLKIDWPTGIILDGGTSHGLSGVQVNGNLKVTGQVVVGGSTVINSSGQIAYSSLTGTPTSGQEGIDISGSLTDYSDLTTSSFIMMGNTFGSIYRMHFDNFNQNMTMQTGDSSTRNYGTIDIRSGRGGNSQTNNPYYASGGNTGSVGGSSIKIAHNSGELVLGCATSNFNLTQASGNHRGFKVYLDGRIDHVSKGSYGMKMVHRGSSSAFKQVVFEETGGNEIGSITINNTANTTSFNETSDYRIKENVVGITSALDKINQLRPVNFNFIGKSVKLDGFLAHEVQAVIPYAVSGEKDAVKTVKDGDESDDGSKEDAERIATLPTKEIPDLQQLDKSKLITLLTASVQELSAKNDALEARIKALESS